MGSSQEAFRYQNYLSLLLSQAMNYLSCEPYITTTIQSHNRTKVNPDAQDEKITIQKPYNVIFEPNDLIDFVVKVIEKKKSSRMLSQYQKEH